MNIDSGLDEFATPRQLEYLAAVRASSSPTAAAKAMGVHHSALCRSMNSLRTTAAKRGYAPEASMTKAVPHPFIVRGVSTLYDKDGEVSQQWVKSRIDDAKVAEAMRAAVEALAEDVARVAPVVAPKDVSRQLANLYTLTDTHIGAKAWDKECGADWDLVIAEDTLTKAFQHLVDSTPTAKLGIVNFLGDICHYDSLDAVTPQHRNLLDADSRYPKMVQVAVRTLRAIITAALSRHEKVIVSFQEGNHDPASSVWLQTLFALLFENEPRVEVLDSVRPYSVIQFKDTMIAFHHGHLSKNAQLPMLFAAEFPKVWGATTRRYCHTGHRHHVEEKEHGGMIVIQHATIAARDAYAARGGWTADRSMTAITYHEDYGQVGRTTVVPDMFQ